MSARSEAAELAGLNRAGWGGRAGVKGIVVLVTGGSSERFTKAMREVDGLVNNAGVASVVPALQDKSLTFGASSRRTSSARWFSKLVAKYMRDGDRGSIVNASSTLGGEDSLPATKE